MRSSRPFTKIVAGALLVAGFCIPAIPCGGPSLSRTVPGASINIPRGGEVDPSKNPKRTNKPRVVAQRYGFDFVIHLSQERVELVRKPVRSGTYVGASGLTTYSVKGRVFAVEATGSYEQCAVSGCAVNACGEILVRYLDNDGDGRFEQVVVFDLDAKKPPPTVSAPAWTKNIKVSDHPQS